MPTLTKEDLAKRNLGPIIFFKGQINTIDASTIYRNCIGLAEELQGEYKSRNGEDRYKQILRNIVCHQGKEVRKTYAHGYVLDKMSRPAVYTLTHGIEEVTPLSPDELEDKIRELSLMNTSAYYGKYSIAPGIEACVEYIEKSEIAKAEKLHKDLGLRVFNLLRDFPYIYKMYGVHLISVNEEGDPISIRVRNNVSEPYDDETREFLKKRYLNGYTKDKSFVYTINIENSADIQLF